MTFSRGQSERRPRGRPPISPSGPLNSAQLVEIRKLSVRQARLGEKRRRAVSCRRDRQPLNITILKRRYQSLSPPRKRDVTSEIDSEDLGKITGEEQLVDNSDFERGKVIEEFPDDIKNVNSNKKTGGDGTGGMYGTMTKSDWFRKLVALKSVLEPHNEIEKCDIVVKLLVRTQLVPFNSDDAAVFLDDRISKLSDWKLRIRVDNMPAILKTSKEPALFMKKLLQ